MSRLSPLLLVTALMLVNGVSGAAARGPLDPLGRIHIPIGIADSLDTLKTFVEAEGPFSPGFGTYGIYVWLYDRGERRLTAPTAPGARTSRGLVESGYPIPWTSFEDGRLTISTELCQVERDSPAGRVQVVGMSVRAANPGEPSRRISLYVALRSLGPAGGPVPQLSVSDDGRALMVEGHPALVALRRPDGAGVLPTDTIGGVAQRGETPGERHAASPSGNCSGALRYDVTLESGNVLDLHFVCPVLPGRRAARHQWDGVSEWAQLDLAQLDPPEGGLLQPDPGLGYYRRLRVPRLFADARRYWRRLIGRARVETPDPRWGEAFQAIAAHVALAMNEGAPDVSVVNYNVFNRDGVYVTNILQKVGQLRLAEKAIDYFLAHPFNGRVYPEADNPGQILWVMGEHWRFSRDRQWLMRVYPSARKLAAMIRYYRRTPGRHWVSPTRLDFGDALPEGARQELKPGRCDGHHPEYTEAFDLAGLRAAELLAREAGEPRDAEEWRSLYLSLAADYDRKYGDRLPREYGSYCVLWPCRLYPYREGRAFEQFRTQGAQDLSEWRYFALAAAHQGLLAGSREAAVGTLEKHLDHEQMREWYAFDEGGKSGSGGWSRARTTWNGDVAMPHGWAVAELHLLLRDALLHEDGDRLVLFGGVPEEWLRKVDPGAEPRAEPRPGHPGRRSQSVLAGGIRLARLSTYFGDCSLLYRHRVRGAVLTLTGACSPPGGFVLRLPETLRARVYLGKRELPAEPNGDFILPGSARRVRLVWEDRRQGGQASGADQAKSRSRG